MDWNIRSPPTSSLQTKNFRFQGPYISQQSTASSGFSQANASMQNSCTYLGSNQTIKLQSSTNNIAGNNIPFQSTGGSKKLQPIFPNELVSSNGSVPSQHVLNVAPVSLSSVTVQMAGGITQNSSLMRNVLISSTGAIQSSTGNPVQNVHQTVNPYMTVDSYNNQPLQNCSNSMKTSVYQQASKNKTSPKRLPMLMPYYYMNGPATSQASATVPHNSTSSHYLNSQHNFSCLVYPLGLNIQKQTNGPNSNLSIAMQSQNYASDNVNPPPYTVSIHHDSRNANQITPQVTDTNCPSAYLVPPIQANHGQFLPSQAAANITNISNENVQTYQSPVLDQISNLYSAQHGQKPQSAPIARETNEVGSTGLSITGQRTENQLSNESANSSVEVGESLANSVQVAGTVLPDEASTPQPGRSLEQENTSGNGSINFPENVSKFKITRESLAVDFQKLYEMKLAFLKHKAACTIKRKMYLSSVQKKQTSDLSIHNQNPNSSLPSLCNTNQNQPLPLPYSNQVFQVPSYEDTQNQSFSPISCGSNQIKDVPLLPQMTDNHLLPILRNMLQGTVDEGMLSDIYVEKRARHQNKYLDVQENSSNVSLVSGGSKYENHVNNIDKSSRLSPKASPADTTQAPLTCIKNALGFQQTSIMANSQLEKGSAASGEGLFYHFKLNKATIGSSNKRLANELPSSDQNPAAANGSSLLTKKVIQEGSKKVHYSGSTGPALIQQGKNPCLQKSEKNIITGGSKSVSDTSGSTSLLSKIAVAVPEADTVEKPSITGNSCKEGRTCSLEELETSLALWRKCLPASLNRQLSQTMESVVNLPSSDDIDEKKQTLENIPNILIQNDQTKVTTGSNETTQSSSPLSLGKNFDSNLLKGSEPQIAIVTPLILAKKSTQNEVQKNSPSLEIMNPIIEEGSLHSLEELLSTIPDTDKGICSPSDSCKYCKDVDKHQKPAKSTEENGVLKDESVINSCDLNQGIDSNFPPESQKLKSQLSSGDNFPPEMNADFAGPVPQKDVKSGLDLQGSGDIAEVVHDDTELQISSICTLVQGDAFYNSQIASIFSTEPLKSNIKNDTSSKEHTPYLQHNKQQLGLLQSDSKITTNASEWNVLLPSSDSLTKAIAEKIGDFQSLEMPQSNKTSDEISVRNSEEEKCSYFPECMPVSGKKLEQNKSCTDLANDNEDLSRSKEDLINTSAAGIMSIINKESTLEHVPAEENLHSGSDIETPATLLNDQLTELSKEFPYGIGDLKALKELTSQDSVTKPTEREDKENAKICGKKTDSSDGIDQIKIIILNSQQMKEVFPEHSQQSCNKAENQLIIDSKANLTRECISHSKTDQVIDVDNRNVPAEMAVKKRKHTYCCLHGWLASVYAMEPCSCMLAKEAASKEKVDLYSESKTMFKDRLKASKIFKTECILNDQLQTSTLNLDSNGASGDQSNKIFKRTSEHKETDFQVNKYKPSKVDQEDIPLSFLERLDSMKAQRNNEQVMKELPFDATSISLKTEPVEIHDQTYTQECISTDQTQCPSSTEDLNVVVSGNLGKMESSNKLRTSLKSKTDVHRHRRIEIKHSSNYERYKIKRDSSETHMIKGPASRKCLMEQVAMERKHKALGIQHTDATNSSNISSVGLVSERYENSQLNSALQSQGHLNGKKLEKIKDLKKKYAYRKAERNESTCSVHMQDNSERTQDNSENTQCSIKRINLEKYAYSKEKKNAWKHRHPYLDNKKTTPQKQRGLSNISKNFSPGKEVALDAHNRDKWSERTLSDKKACFNRKNSKLSISLQREQKKNYLNRVAFKRTTQKIIRLTNIESTHSNSVWHVKSNSVSGCPEDQKKSSSPFPLPKAEKLQMLEFKMCPEILFKNSVMEEQIIDAKLPEKDRTPITAVKSKREDWLNYIPAKRRKTMETEAQVDEDIPLDTAIKILDGVEAFHIPVKDSKATFQTYRKLHLEKRSRSLDSSPVN